VRAALRKIVPSTSKDTIEKEESGRVFTLFEVRVFEGLELFPQSRRGSAYAARFFTLVNSNDQFCNSLHISGFHSTSSRLVGSKPDSMIHYHVCFLQLLGKTVHVLLAVNVEEDLV
jgi:hypothetical protein